MSLPPLPHQHERVLGLDLLRLLAVVMVLTSHMPYATDEVSALLRCYQWFGKYCGSYGVDLFFVLSGYLVSGLLFKEYQTNRSLSVVRFYARRAWKIYPSFYVLLAVTAVMQVYVVKWLPPTSALLSEALFLQCYVKPFWNHTWSLAVEEHFYLVMPLLLAVLVRLNPGHSDPFRSIPKLVLACCAFCLLARGVTFLYVTEYDLWTHFFPTHLRIDALFFGVGIAYLRRFRHEWFVTTFKPWRRLLPLAGVSVIVALSLLKDNLPIYGSHYYHMLGFVHLYVGMGLILIGVTLLQIPRNLVTSAAAKIGSYSYSIYLWHLAAKMWVLPSMREAGWSWGTQQMTFWFMAFGVGIVMANLVELPLLALRERWTPSRLSDTKKDPLITPGRTIPRVAA